MSFGPKKQAAAPQAIPPVSATAKEVTDAQRETLMTEKRKKGIGSTILSRKPSTSFGAISKLGGY